MTERTPGIICVLAGVGLLWSFQPSLLQALAICSVGALLMAWGMVGEDP